MLIAVIAGLAAGTVISIITVLLEHSRIGINSYALYGNGALIVPAIFAPFSLYVGWTWLRANGGRGLEMALFVLGLHLGVGVTSILDVLFYPSGPDIGLADALPGFILSGSIFVLPAALLAGLAYWIATRAHGLALGAAAIVGVLVAAVLAVFFGVGLGILAGGTVALVERVPSRRVEAGVALFVALLVIGNLPFLSALVTPAS